MSVSLQMAEQALKICEEIAMSKIDLLKMTIEKKDWEIKRLRLRALRFVLAIRIARRERDHANGIAHQYEETIGCADIKIKTLRERIATLENAEAISIQYIKTLEGAVKNGKDRIAFLEELNASKGETRPITKEQWDENFK